MPFKSLYISRYVLHAIRILSVPPLVIVPHPVAGALYIDNTIATDSASIRRIPGKISGCKGFATANILYASDKSLVRSSPP